ncbi:hypothetical protein VP5_045 [Vibrio virus VPMCC5]|nr:hypothetical protein VP5_045 [Vibrio virus VPMCC5]
MTGFFKTIAKALTRNTIKFTGKYATQAANAYINKRSREGEWWEFVENNEGRAIIIRRRCRE